MALWCCRALMLIKNLLVGITESAGANLDWMIEKFYKLEKNDPAISNIYAFIDKETEGVPRDRIT